MNVYLIALGCKLNQAEVDALARRFADAGHRVVRDPAGADWAVVNTCAVTHVAARKSRQLLRQLRRAQPDLRIAVIGCYGETDPERAAALAGVQCVIPNAAKDEVVARVLAHAGDDGGMALRRPSVTASGRTRALVKIQDGCDNACTYCVVRLARGAQRSRPPEEVLADVAARVAEGYREVVLTGVHIGAYGRDSAPDAPLPPERDWSLARLVGEILRRTPPTRLRLSSIEPWDVTADLLALWQDPRLCRHLHLPLQSGCDATLRRMGRHYTAADLAALVRLIRQRVPGVALTTDVIVGFPGETEAEFQETCAFVDGMAFSRLHVFRYSPRPGTVAAMAPDPVAPPVAQARGQVMARLGRDLAQRYHRCLVGQEVTVLFEAPRQGPEGAMWSGLTDTYVRATAPSGDDLGNVLARVRCEGADASGVWGRIVTALGTAEGCDGPRASEMAPRKGCGAIVNVL